MFYLNYIVYLWHTWAGETRDLPHWSPCFDFFVCHSRRTHYPTLEKPGAQNIAAYGNPGKQRELSDHWKSIKKLFSKKITGDDAKKTKKLTGIQVLTKDFTFYKIRLSL